MKKLVFFMICCVGFFALISQHEKLFGRLQWLEAPRVHVVQEGESLSKLAKENYGRYDYWRELALINRAPRPSHLEPGEQILLPAASVLRDLRNARTLSRVNEIVKAQTAAAGNNAATAAPVTSASPASEVNVPAPPAGPETAPAVAPAGFAEEIPSQTEGNGGSFWFWVILGLIALGGVVGFVFYRRRQEQQEKFELEKETANGDHRNFPNDRRSLIQRKQQEGAAV